MYYEIFNGLITTVAESAVSAVVEQAVEWFFKKDSKKKDIPTDEDTPAVAVPLAIGYYHYSDILSEFHFLSSFIRRFRWD
jgi:hypothetical protein